MLVLNHYYDSWIPLWRCVSLFYCYFTYKLEQWHTHVLRNQVLVPLYWFARLICIRQTLFTAPMICKTKRYHYKMAVLFVYHFQCTYISPFFHFLHKSHDDKMASATQCTQFCEQGGDAETRKNCAALRWINIYCLDWTGVRPLCWSNMELCWWWIILRVSHSWGAHHCREGWTGPFCEHRWRFLHFTDRKSRRVGKECRL